MNIYVKDTEKVIYLLKKASLLIKNVGDGNWKNEDVKWQDNAIEWNHQVSEYINPRKKRIFLGGTCNESTWREKFITLLNPDKLTYVNPVVDDWNEEAQKIELLDREMCDYCIYTITPRMSGVYSIAEVIDDSNKRPKKTIFILLQSDADYIYVFPVGEWKSLEMVAKMVKRNGGRVYYSLESAAEYLNAIEGAK
jgi:hypothetical protein